MDARTKEKIVYAHGGLMIFVWMFAVPFAVAANMYSRKKGKSWGVTVHMIVMGVVAFLPMVTSFFMALVAAGGALKVRPHSVNSMQYIVGPHSHFFIVSWYTYIIDKLHPSNIWCRESFSV